MRIFEYIDQGGPIMYLLVVINFFGFALMLTKFFLYGREKKNGQSIVEELVSRIKSEAKVTDSNTLIEISKRYLSEYIMGIEKGLNTVKVIASISPLLGLLGTVIGVLVAFQVMSQTGLSDPSSFAEGISMALITTVGGMIVAIPHFVGHNYLTGMLDNLETSLEKEIISKVV